MDEHANRAFVFSPRQGIFGLWVGSNLWQVRAPWWPKTYSERAGASVRTIAALWGWRLTVKGGW